MAVSMGMATIAAGVNTPFEIPQGSGGVLLSNESGLRVLVLFEGAKGFSRVLNAGSADFFIVPKGFNGNLLFKPSAELSNTSSWPSSYIDVEAFGPGERPAGVYPMALSRANNIGNSLNLSTSTTILQNDGNPSGTQFIEVTVSGAPGSSFSFASDGTVFMAELIANVVTKFFQSFPGATIVLAFGESGKQVQIIGKTIMDSIVLTGNASRPKISSDASGNINFDIPDGTRIMQVNSGGIDLTTVGQWSATVKRIMVSKGSLLEWNVFSGVGSGSFAHGLSVAPNIVLPNPATGAASSQTIGIETPYGVANVNITAGAGLAWQCLAIAF